MTTTESVSRCVLTPRQIIQFRQCEKRFLEELRVPTDGAMPAELLTRWRADARLASRSETVQARYRDSAEGHTAAQYDDLDDAGRVATPGLPKVRWSRTIRNPADLARQGDAIAEAVNAKLRSTQLVPDDDLSFVEFSQNGVSAQSNLVLRTADPKDIVNVATILTAGSAGNAWLFLGGLLTAMDGDERMAGYGSPFGTVFDARLIDPLQTPEVSIYRQLGSDLREAFARWSARFRAVVDDGAKWTANPGSHCSSCQVSDCTLSEAAF